MDEQGIPSKYVLVASQNRNQGGKFDFGLLLNRSENKELFGGRSVILIRGFDFWEGVGNISQMLFKPVSDVMEKWIEKFSGIKLSLADRAKLRGEFNIMINACSEKADEIRDVKLVMTQQ